MKTAHKEEGEKKESDVKEEEKEEFCKKESHRASFGTERSLAGLLSPKKVGKVRNFIEKNPTEKSLVSFFLQSGTQMVKS
jgi:hypothetical protein